VIEVARLVRRFGELEAVAGIDFRVAEGEIFGFLGPNGAGKSTTLRILSTLLLPTSGSARVAGYDVVREPKHVRRSLGSLFQDPAVDDRLTARENLALHCAIFGVPRRERAERMDDALRWIGLHDQRNDLVRAFSGGMRRRLEVARALLHQPRVLFLDEPTTGLDPQTRRSLWETLRTSRADRRLTILMTTHYMDEAEHCDRVAIIDHGKLIASGTPAELRQGVGAERVAIETDDDERAIIELRTRFGVAPQRSERGLEFAVEGGEHFLPKLVGFPVEIRSLVLRKPTLEDAFIALTGHSIRRDEAGSRELLRRNVGMRGRMRR
jgi:ABC-2 type transport system ATP-binding protein